MNILFGSPSPIASEADLWVRWKFWQNQSADGIYGGIWSRACLSHMDRRLVSYETWQRTGRFRNHKDNDDKSRWNLQTVKVETFAAKRRWGNNYYINSAISTVNLRAVSGKIKQSLKKIYSQRNKRMFQKSMRDKRLWKITYSIFLEEKESISK